MELKPLTDYIQPDGLGLMIALLLYRERKAEAEARGETLSGIRKEDAHLYDIPF